MNCNYRGILITIILLLALGLSLTGKAQQQLPPPDLGSGGTASPAASPKQVSPGDMPSVTIAAKVDRTDVPLNQVVKLIMELTWDKKPAGGTCELDFDFPDPPKVEGLTAVGNSMRTVTELKGDVHHVTREYIYSYRADKQGQTAIGEVKMPYRRLGSTGEDQELSTAAIPVNVLPPAFNVKEFLSGKWARIVIAGVLVLAVLVLVFTTLLGRKKTKKVEAPAAVVETLEDRTLNALRDNDTYRIAGQYPNYFLGLSRVAQGYIYERYGIRTQGQTTDHIAAGLRDVIGEDMAERVKTTLLLCDKVKFAGHSPSPIEMDRSFEAVRSLVEAGRKEVKCEVRSEV